MSKTFYYSDERNIQILISLLKQSGIKKIIASPGATNVSFVGSLQNDPYFEMYSCVDERSAAYMACGMAAESGEPVVLSCTGATSSRNYMPALTEAYYRKLPILAVTSTQDIRRVGHMIAQVTDRSVKPNDVCVHAEYIPTCTDAIAEWDATIRINRAILALRHHGGGPVHINLATVYSKNFSVKELPVAKVIRRISTGDKFPEIGKGKRVAIFVGSHTKWSERMTTLVDKFCTKYNAVVFCDHSSNYKSNFRVCNAIVGTQSNYKSCIYEIDLLIHIGEISGDYADMGPLKASQQVWRVNEDRELRDQFQKLTYVFEMHEEDFFENYVKDVAKIALTNDYLELCKNEYDHLQGLIPELPFSNLWIAHQTAGRLPKDSVLHLGILNSLRAWNMFEIPKSVISYVNTGGFGIDGLISACIGGALASPEKLHFLVLGDLSFFYDMNAIGNRHIGNNLRILLVNNGKGTEFKNYNHTAALFGDTADQYIAAAEHFGNKSHQLVRHYAEDLGYEYMQATTKEEYLSHIDRFLIPEPTEKSMILEAFTDDKDESEALKEINNLIKESEDIFKKTVKKILPETMVKTLKKQIKR